MSLAGERSPPAARSPAGSSSACSGGGNHSGASFGESQVIVFTGPSGRGFSVGHVLPDLGGVVVDGVALALEVVADRLAEGGIADVMRRPRERRLEAAAHLVLALGAGLEAPDPALDAELDPLVVAGLEVQAVVVGGGAPVTAVERLLRPEEDRRRDRCRRRWGGAGLRCRPMHGDLDHECIRERSADLAEELAGEIRLVAVPQEGFPVKGVNGVEEALVEICAEAGLEADAGLGHPAALAPGFLALLGRESLEIGLEARVAAVGPMKLAIAPQQPAGALAGRAPGLIDKERVHGREPPARRVRLKR